MKKCLYVFLLGLGVVSNQAIYTKHNDDSLKLVTISFALILEVQREITQCYTVLKELKSIANQTELNQAGYSQIKFLELQKLLANAEKIIQDLNTFLCKAQIHLNPINVKEFSQFNSKFKELYKQFKKVKAEFLTQGIQI